MIGLVSCSSQKLDRAAPARELYCSPLFKLSLRYAQRYCDVVYVLSGKLGLVALDQIVEPYDTRVASGWLRISWARKIATRLRRRHGEDHYFVLAGASYADPLASHIKVVKPLAGMQIGERLQWLTGMLATEAA